MDLCLWHLSYQQLQFLCLFTMPFWLRNWQKIFCTPNWNWGLKCLFRPRSFRTTPASKAEVSWQTKQTHLLSAAFKNSSLLSCNQQWPGAGLPNGDRKTTLLHGLQNNLQKTERQMGYLDTVTPTQLFSGLDIRQKHVWVITFGSWSFFASSLLLSVHGA